MAGSSSSKAVYDQVRAERNPAKQKMLLLSMLHENMGTLAEGFRHLKSGLNKSLESRQSVTEMSAVEKKLEDIT